MSYGRLWMPLKAVIYRCGDFIVCFCWDHREVLTIHHCQFCVRCGSNNLYLQLIIYKSLTFHTILKIVKEKMSSSICMEICEKDKRQRHYGVTIWYKA
uniref:Uncharacterized protein n=1 Tax=Cucumis melo TaxID=3656 RepID=A0A9I9EE83_CUCME